MLKISRNDRKQLKRVLSNLGKRKTKETIFYDLCFCLCAPQTTFKNNIKVIKDLKVYGVGGFYKTPISHRTEIHLRILCRRVRFYNNKARYLIEAKENFDFIYETVKQKNGSRGCYKRDWLVENVKGVGMKVASHFLRNLGDTEIAIIDTHIINFIAKEFKFGSKKVTEEEIKKQIVNKKGYHTIETVFEKMAEDHRLTTAELDLLVWKNYSGTAWKEIKY